MTRVTHLKLNPGERNGEVSHCHYLRVHLVFQIQNVRNSEDSYLAPAHLGAKQLFFLVHKKSRVEGRVIQPLLQICIDSRTYHRRQVWRNHIILKAAAQEECNLWSATVRRCSTHYTNVYSIEFHRQNMIKNIAATLTLRRV